MTVEPGTSQGAKQGYRSYLPSLKRRLQSGETLFGLIVKTPSPATVEMCACAGFDFAVIDAEHGGADAEQLEHHIRAAESFGMRTLVRVGSHMPIETLRALDIGASGIVAPHVCTQADAAGIVQAAHYPPLGKRGLAMTTRAGNHSLLALQTHLQNTLEQTVIVAQIEDQAALSHLDAIASTPGIDVIFVSPTDLSMSLGHPGELEHTAVRAAMDAIAQAANLAEHTALGAFARDEHDAARWVERGAQFILLAATTLIAQRLTHVITALHSRGKEHEFLSLPPAAQDGAG